MGGPVEGVLFLHPFLRFGTLNFMQAALVCKKVGARLATPQQLSKAWLKGMTVCHPGWLADGSVRFPIKTPMPKSKACAQPKITFVGKPNKMTKADVYCFTS